MSEDKKPDDGGFKPIVQFDLLKGTALQFAETVEEFEQRSKALDEPSKLNLSNGWYYVTPEMAQEWLRHNKKGANRKASLTTIAYYARAMRKKDWPKTGQPIIFDLDEVCTDGGQRLWASYLSGASFDTYVVADVPVNPLAFAYMDNNRPRTPSQALATAGFDGVSPLIYAVIQIREAIEQGLYTMQYAHRPERIAPVDVLKAAQEDALLKQAARFTAGDFAPAVNLVGHRAIVAYVSYRIIGIYNEYVAEEWWADVVAPEGDLSEGNAALALRKLLEADAKKDPRNKKDPRLAKHLVLAHCIRAFNLWVAGEQVKRLKIPVADTYPEFAAAIDRGEGGEEQAAA